MFARLFGSAVHGVDAFRVLIEVSVGNGIGYQITGLPDDAIKESLSRIAVAISANGFHMPRSRLVINLAPAGVRKMGTGFDLAITVGILLASEQIVDLEKLQDYVITGEVGLDGSVHPVRGALCMACQARRDGFKGILLPAANAGEASLVKGISVYPIRHLNDLVDFVKMDCGLKTFDSRKENIQEIKSFPDFKDIRGQQYVKRAMEIAAAGGHNTLMIGPPGIGKTMLAKRLPSILPPMTTEEQLETTRIYSVLNDGSPFPGLITERPFRNPHHTASDVAITGGGSILMPGEISLANHGVLFLDELPEFRRSAIEVLRQPLEERKITVARAKLSLEFPASFMLLVAMNPCPCGYFGHPFRPCTCSRRAISWYLRRISGPLLERIDLHVEVEPVPLHELMELNANTESSAAIRERVIKARKIQQQRFANNGPVHCNAQMPDNGFLQYCPLDESAKKFLLNKMQQLQLSARSYLRILKVSRTIADLALSKNIELPHMAEAIHFRSLDKPIGFTTTEARLKKAG